MRNGGKFNAPFRGGYWKAGYPGTNNKFPFQEMLWKLINMFNLKVYFSSSIVIELQQNPFSK